MADYVEVAKISGVSTLGIVLGYGVETTAGTKPATFTGLDRINAIGGIAINSETIDSSALYDLVTRTIRGRGDTGGTWTVTVNFTPETKTQWAAVLSAYSALTEGKRMWFEVIIPTFEDAFFVVAQPPTALPMPEMGQNSLLTVEMTLTIEEYIGMDTKVDFT